MKKRINSHLSALALYKIHNLISGVKNVNGLNGFGGVFFSLFYYSKRLSPNPSQPCHRFTIYLIRRNVFLILFSRVHANLQPALSVGPSVRPSVGLSVRPSHFTFFVFLRSMASLLLPK